MRSVKSLSTLPGWLLLLPISRLLCLRECFKSGSGFARLQSPMALSASIDDKTNIACFGLRALGLFAQARADDPLSKNPLRDYLGI
jgi:hypothetical protein